MILSPSFCQNRVDCGARRDHHGLLEAAPNAREGRRVLVEHHECENHSCDFTRDYAMAKSTTIAPLLPTEVRQVFLPNGLVGRVKPKHMVAALREDLVVG